MKRGILARRSQAAGWGRLAGALAFPVLALAALGARFGVVPSGALVAAFGLAVLMGLLALALGVYALVDIWRTGADGAGAAIAGIAYAGPVLLVLTAVAAAAVYYPRQSEATTDAADPPTFDGLAVDRAEPSLADDGDEGQPSLAAPTYPRPIADVYIAARDLAKARGWEFVREVAPLSLPVEAEPAPKSKPVEVVDAVLEAKVTMTQSRSEAERPPAPDAPEPAPPPQPDSGTFQAVARTPLLGFADDVVVRLRETPEGTRVDLRSASRIGTHDLGQNTRRIMSFLADLDLALQPAPGVPAGPVVATPAPPPAGQ